MIPKILHFIWVGNNPLPEYSLNYINMFESMYNDYEVKLWTDIEVNQNDLIPDFLYDYYFNNEFHPAFKADILRYLILNKYGGLYFDTDFEPLRKLPDYFLSFNFLGGIQPNNQVAIGFIGSKTNCNVLNNIINKIVVSIEIAKVKGYYNNSYIHKMTGPEFFDPIVNEYKNKPECFFFTKEYFYPYWFTDVERRVENFKESSPLAYAVHHWKQSWKQS